MKKFTKIVATIGPTSDSPEMITKLLNAGVNVFRFNLKHNVFDWHLERIQRVTDISRKLGIALGILIDLQGPEVRILMPHDQLEIAVDEELLLGETIYSKPEIKGFSVSHPDIVDYLLDGQKIVADDGAFTFTTVRRDKEVWLKSHTSGVLKNRKTMNIPGADFPLPVIHERDREALKLAKTGVVDFIALSFVRNHKDIAILREEMKQLGVQAQVVSKIETQSAINDLDKIIKVSDGVMVARGDLGVELPFEEVPYYQKMIIKKCLEKGTPVIMATQCLQSMVEYSFPTRAEISDIANATYDMTDAVMLSNETAAGKFPEAAVDIMARTVSFNEKRIHRDSRMHFSYELGGQDSLMADAAYSLYVKMQHHEQPIKGFVVFTTSGRTVRWLSALRPKRPIFALCPSITVAESLTVNYAVCPFEFNSDGDKKESVSDRVMQGLKSLEAKGLISSGDRLIVLHGDKWSVVGGTSTVKLVTWK